MSNFNQNVIKHKLGLLNLATELGNISQACKIMGVSRDTFYRYQEVIEQAVVQFATDFPAHGQTRASNELRKLGIFISPSGVRSVWLRYNLESMKKRLVALEKKSASSYRSSSSSFRT